MFGIDDGEGAVAGDLVLSDSATAPVATRENTKAGPFGCSKPLQSLRYMDIRAPKTSNIRSAGLRPAVLPSSSHDLLLAALASNPIMP